MILKSFKSALVFFLIFFCPVVSRLYAQNDREIVVSAATSLKNAFEEIAALYEKRTGVRVSLNLGASGLLQKQIETGAPVDVFASAGVKQMDALETGGFIAAGSRRNLTRNTLVLIVPSHPIPTLHAFGDLLRSDVKRLAIGNPKTVPAGQYAAQALSRMRLWDSLSSRIVPAENVRQVLDYVVRGEADAGIVYASDVAAFRGKATVVARAPEESHDPILYPIAMIRGTENSGDAAAFIELTLDDAGQTIMGKYGFLSSR